MSSNKKADYSKSGILFCPDCRTEYTELFFNKFLENLCPYCSVKILLGLGVSRLQNKIVECNNGQEEKDNKEDQSG